MSYSDSSDLQSHESSIRELLLKQAWLSALTTFNCVKFVIQNSETGVVMPGRVGDYMPKIVDGKVMMAMTLEVESDSGVSYISVIADQDEQVHSFEAQMGSLEGSGWVEGMKLEVVEVLVKVPEEYEELMDNLFSFRQVVAPKKS
jgi:hypothetical protein